MIKRHFIVTVYFLFLLLETYGQKSKCDSIREANKFDLRGTPTGRFVWLDSLCRITQIDTFLNGKVNGTQIGYTPDGNVRFKYLYVNGSREGSAYYVESDTLKIYGQFKDNVRQGEFLVYNLRGTLYKKIQYTDGVWDGDYFIYFKSGRVHIKKIYDKGELILRQVFKDDAKNSLESETDGRENNNEVEGGME